MRRVFDGRGLGDDNTLALNAALRFEPTAVDSTLDHWGLSATAEWDLSRSLVLKSISAVRRTAWTGIRDADNTAFDMLATAIDSDSQQFSQELQALVAQNEAVTFITAAMTLEDRQRGWQLTLSVDNLSDKRSAPSSLHRTPP